jgi:twinkle protein
MPKANKEISVIEFPYIVFGKTINVKYRGKDKDFMFEKGCELVMFNLDAIAHEKECVIVEGEFDALAFVEAGINYVTSVPNGFTLPKKDGTSSINLSYLDDYYSFFENKEKIFLAVDNDEAGKHGRDELIRRFGSEKCYLVDFNDCKDANEYLLKHGKEKLAGLLNDAKQVPIENIQTLKDFEYDLDDFWLNGSPKGYLTGIENVDKNYSFEFGQYTLMVGTPQSGKSELVDSMCIGYALKYGLKTAFASPENKPNRLHADKIIRKIAGYRPSTIEEIKSKRIQRAKQFYNDHFLHLEYNDGYDLEKILTKFTELVKRKGVRVFVIDPYNKTRLKKANGKNVNEYTADYLNEIDIFCQKHKVHVILVVHPVKMQKIEGTNSYQMPTAYDIKGGGEMFDMAYHILSIGKETDKRLVKFKTLKVKFQHLGTPDELTYLKWNVNNGRYASVDYDETVGGDVEVFWDNGDWLTSKETDKKIVEEYAEMPEFSSNPLDLAAKRIQGEIDEENPF